MSASIVSNHQISGEAIEPIIADIEAAISGYDRNHIILALLCMTFMLSDPELPPERVSEYVKNVSRYIVMLLGTQSSEMVH